MYKAFRTVFKPLEWLMLGMIKFYQLWISPMLGPKCKFYPSCSAYGYESISVHGPFKGLLLTIYRVFRCHPWQLGGIDPVPSVGAWRPEVNLDGSPKSLNRDPNSSDLSSSVSSDSLEYRS